MPSTSNKPPFNGAVGGIDMALQSKPPIQFQGVTARFFPLKANMYRLRSFCDLYLNIAPDIVEFRPALPYVYLMALDYGKMAATVGNMGWVSQHEVGFAVPLEWYRRDKDRMVFVDFATVCPFIFVDNEMSLAAGRDVYGWPKTKVWLEPEANPWLSDLGESAPLLTMNSMIYRELYAGKRQEPEMLLQIRQRPFPRLLESPPDLMASLNPFRIASRAFSGYVNLLGQFTELFSRLPLMGYDRTRGLSAWLDLLRRGAKSLNLLSPAAPSNQITLKQFRDAEYPGAVCYQAIVNSEMRVKKYNGGGILGDLSLLAGDISGGFEIDLRRDLAQPIIESLGVEVAGEETHDGTRTAHLKPVFPFWLDLDLEYGIGEALCWRTRTSSWHTGSSAVEAPAATPALPNHPFNTALGAGAQDVTGPFDFPNTTVRVLPLLADKSRLQKLIDDYLNDACKQGPYYFQVWGSYVYLLVTNFGEMSSETNNIGWWADRELAFHVPVKVYDREHEVDDRERELLSVALVPVFIFANSEVSAITGREVSGQPVIAASIKSPSNTWLADSGPADSAERGLLTLETMLLPALHLGQEVHWGLLLDIHEADALPYNDDVRWHMVAGTWGDELLRDHRRKVGLKQVDLLKRQNELLEQYALVKENERLEREPDFENLKRRYEGLKQDARLKQDTRLKERYERLERRYELLVQYERLRQDQRPEQPQGVEEPRQILEQQHRLLEQQYDLIEQYERLKQEDALLKKDAFLNQYEIPEEYEIHAQHEILERYEHIKKAQLVEKDELLKQYERFDNLRALALEVLANGQPINTITLKQYPDVGDPGCACYQALVRGGRVIDRIYDIREIEERIHLRIRRYPNLPIAKTLGLKVKWTDTKGDAAVDIIQPIRPFWMRLGMRENLGENLRWRAGRDWLPDPSQTGKESQFYFKMKDPTGVGRELVGRARQRLGTMVREWRSEAKRNELLSREEASDCVKKVDPDAAIESILSKEWEHWGNPRWYRKQQGEQIEQKPDFCIRADSAGPSDADILFPKDRRTPDFWWYSEQFPDPLEKFVAEKLEEMRSLQKPSGASSAKSAASSAKRSRKGNQK